MKHIRLFPLVLFATASLFLLKGLGIMRHGHYTVQDQAEVVLASAAVSSEKTGIFAGTTANNVPRKECAPLAGSLESPKADDQLAEKLSEKRKELDARLKELDLRENAIKTAEKRLDERGREVRSSEGRTVDGQKKVEEKQPDQIRSLISMYDTMKPKDAAKIFDKLDLSIMSQLALKLKPAKMAEIMAEMTPDTAKKLTTELALQGNRSRAMPENGNSNELPKIEGKNS